ncbi:MAG: TonB-dependent receptor [Desulfuromonadales bacterium]|nr:TonB-dependent receptor [Desulfuromonadales bacterium]
MQKLVWLTVVLSLSAAAAVQPVAAEEARLKPVVVTATRVAQPVTDVAASVSVITAEEIAERGANRLDELLQDVVGLHVVSSGGRGSLSSPSIRGSEASQVLVLLDGVRLNSPQYGQFDLNQLPISLSDIERIEVLRGPASALYGSSALGGVIQIISKAPADSPQSRVGWTEGRHDTRILSAATARRHDRLRYRLGGEYQESDGYRDNADFEQSTLNGLVGYALNDDVDLELSLYHLDYDSGIPGSIAWPSPQAEQDDRRTIAALKLAAPVGPFAIAARTVYERHRNDYRDPGGWSPTADRHKLDSYGLEVDARREFGPHRLLFGADLYRDELDSSSVGDREQERGSLYGQLQAELPAGLSLLLGLRYDIHSDFSNELSPRAALLAPVSDSARLRLSASRAFRAPTLNDRYWPAGPFTRGNPDLDAETAWEYELAVEQDLPGQGRVALAAFQREADDLIRWQADDQFVYSPVNVAKARIWGVELDGSYPVCRFARIGGNYTYLHPKDRKTGDYLRGKPRHELHGFVALHLHERTGLRFDGRYLRYYAEANRTDKDYFVADLALNHTLEIGAVAVDATLAVKNLFDKDYESNPGYPMPPREWFAGLTARF